MGDIPKRPFKQGERSDIYLSFEYAALMKVNVINLSIGFQITTSTLRCAFYTVQPLGKTRAEFDILREQLNKELDDMERLAGSALVVVAGANCPADSGSEVYDFPTGEKARLSWLHVTASNKSDFLELAAYGRDSIDIAAPGTEIVVLSSAATSGVRANTAFGTSFATPMVSGTAVLILAREPTLLSDPKAGCRLADRILNNADRLDWLKPGGTSRPVGRDGMRLNAGRAVSNPPAAIPYRLCD